MNNIAFYCDYDKQVFKDRLFSNPSPDYENLFSQLKKKKYCLHTLDIFKKRGIDPNLCIFLDMPKRPISKIINLKKTKSLLLLREGEHIIKINFDYKRHKDFTNILTWKKKLIDNKKYFFMNCGRSYKPRDKLQINYDRRSLCTIINSNLRSNNKNELYSHRLKVIKWFENYHLKDFDLYGYGWDKLSIFLGNRKIISTHIFGNPRKSFKGTPRDKISTLSKYKFCICFENGIIESHIDEKIIDCFNARVIPIYYGAPDIKEFVSEKCFIDFRRFNNLDEMYDFMISMTKKEYLRYISNIENYLLCENYKKYFSIESWADSVQKRVLALTKNI